jgi:nitrogen fixation/metabolism regulation signal transduction histidine kinase
MDGLDPYALQEDAGLRTILGASLLDDRVLYAAIVDVNRVIIAHYDSDSVGEPLPRPTGDDLSALVDAGPLDLARTLFSGGVRTYEVRTPLLLGNLGDGGDLREFGSVVIGISTGLVQLDFTAALRTPVYTAVTAMVVAMVVSMLLAQLMLRPIHVIRSGLARLGRGELDIDVELPQDEDLGDLGDSLKAISARLASDRSALAGQRATLASVVEHLEDAVAIFAPDGMLLFANPAMSQVLSGTAGRVQDLLPDGHPYRAAVEAAMMPGERPGPQTVAVPDAGERLLITDRIVDADNGPLGVLLVSRNLAYLNQVESTLNYSRKLAALGRLSSGIAHEVKNPLNATMIHLELLRGKIKNQPDAMEHVSVITAQMRRLDEVVQGFLKFTRPEELRLRPVTLSIVVDRVLPVVRAEAESHGVTIEVDCPADLPEVSADDGLLEQAFLNLA